MTDQPEPTRQEALRQLLLLSGRPLPRVIFVGPDLAHDCRLLDACGGAATGVAADEDSLEHARLEYPEGTFVCGPIHDPPLEDFSHDVAWAGIAFADVPTQQLADALRGLHRALRPGGLLAITRPQQSVWTRPELGAALDKLDFTFTRELPDAAGPILVFRREY